MNKIKIFGILAVVLLFLLSLYFFFRPGNNNPSTSQTKNTIRLESNSGSVEVKNFSDQIIKTAGAVVLIADQPEYSIEYYKKDESFTITLLKTPVDKSRDLAEKQLLKALDIGIGDACKLKTEVLVPYSVDPDNSGKNLGLSFCPNAVSF